MHGTSLLSTPGKFGLVLLPQVGKSDDEEHCFLEKFGFIQNFRFGVCCVFLVADSGVAINQNCTYIRNPGFPSTYGGSSGVSHTINKCSDGKS